VITGTGMFLRLLTACMFCRMGEHLRFRRRKDLSGEGTSFRFVKGCSDPGLVDSWQSHLRRQLTMASNKFGQYVHDLNEPIVNCQLSTDSRMQYALQLQLLNKRQVILTDSLRYKNKLLIINLCADIVAYPVFICEVKQFLINRFHEGCAAS
jgi:hypothetical protein